MLLVCNSRWFGEIPATSEVAIQACIKEGLCSEVLGDGRYEPGNAPEERDEADAAECLQYPSSCGGALSGEIATSAGSGAAVVDVDWWDTTYGGPTLSLDVTLSFMPAVASTIGAHDRPSLTVRGDDDVVLVDSVASDPYVVSTVDPGDGSAPFTCKTALLNLDGSTRYPLTSGNGTAERPR
jgi:hypothetical protein